MKTFIISLVVLILGAFALSPTALAVDVFSNTCASSTGSTAVCSEAGSAVAKNNEPVLVIMKAAISILSYIIGIASVIVILVAGFQFIVSGSDAQALKNARNTLIYALVGVAIAALAQVIVVFVLNTVK